MATKLLFVSACVLMLTLQTASAAKRMLVEIDSGKVRGQVKLVPELGRRYVAQFLGVPYAQPPVGELRFAAPRPVRPWNGKRNAQEFGSRCPQNQWPFPFNVTVGEWGPTSSFVRCVL